MNRLIAKNHELPFLNIDKRPIRPRFEVQTEPQRQDSKFMRGKQTFQSSNSCICKASPWWPQTMLASPRSSRSVCPDLGCLEEVWRQKSGHSNDISINSITPHLDCLQYFYLIPYLHLSASQLRTLAGMLWHLLHPDLPWTWPARDWSVVGGLAAPYKEMRSGFWPRTSNRRRFTGTHCVHQNFSQRSAWVPGRQVLFQATEKMEQSQFSNRMKINLTKENTDQSSNSRQSNNIYITSIMILYNNNTLKSHQLNENHQKRVFQSPALPIEHACEPQPLVQLPATITDLHRLAWLSTQRPGTHSMMTVRGLFFA